MTLWRRWTFQAPVALTVLAALYFFWIGPAYDEYLMSGGRFQKTFPAGRWGQPEDVDFTVRGCTNVTRVPARADGLQSLQWHPDGVLFVRYTVSEYCAAPFDNGGYSISGSTLLLHYGLNYWTSARAACTCAYDLEYRIRGVPRAEYSVQVRATSR